MPAERVEIRLHAGAGDERVIEWRLPVS
jgi:hypothetical protein